MPIRFRFPRCARLTARSEYDQVFKRGEKLAGRAFICHVTVDASLECRLGLVVSRKVGKAVTRNRVKRHIRTFFRLNRQRYKAGLQLVVVALPTSAALTGNACAEILERRLKKYLQDA